MEQIQRWDYFPSSIYSVDRPDFLEDNKGNQSLNYNGIIGVLVEAIKELNSKVDKLEGKQ